MVLKQLIFIRQLLYHICRIMKEFSYCRYHKLNNLRHSNGERVVIIYGNHHLQNPYKEDQGPIVTLNVCRL